MLACVGHAGFATSGLGGEWVVLGWRLATFVTPVRDHPVTLLVRYLTIPLTPWECAHRPGKNAGKKAGMAVPKENKCFVWECGGEKLARQPPKKTSACVGVWRFAGCPCRGHASFATSFGWCVGGECAGQAFGGEHHGLTRSIRCGSRWIVIEWHWISCGRRVFVCVCVFVGFVLVCVFLCACVFYLW